MRRSRLLATILSVCVLTSAEAAKPLPCEGRQASPVAPQTLTATAVAELINECGRRTTLMTRRVADYTYTIENIERELDKQGNVKRESVNVYEAYPAYGRRSVLVHVSEDGVPRDSEKVERERKRAADELVEAEKRAAKAGRLEAADPERQSSTEFVSYGVRRTGGKFGGGFYIRPTDFLTSHEFSPAGRSQLNDREALVLTFRPRTGFNASDGSTRVLSRLAGHIWIDARDKVIIRLEAFPLQELKDGASPSAPARDVSAPVVFELTRLPNGTWVPSLFVVNTRGRESVFEGVKSNITIRYREFKLFSTSVEQEKLDAP